MAIFKKIFKALKTKISSRKKPSRKAKKPLKKSPPPKQSKNRKTRIASKKTSVKRPKAPAAIEGSPVGKVIHYFTRIQVGVVKLTKASIHLNDKIRIKGHTTDFIQTIKSLQMDNTPVPSAPRGKSVGLKVDKRVRRGDAVYKI